MSEHQQELIKMYKELDAEFKKINFDWFPFAGTLLGTVRDSGLIHWDDDIDMVSRASDIKENITQIKKIADKLDIHIFSYIEDNNQDVVRFYSKKKYVGYHEGKKYSNYAIIEIHPLIEIGTISSKEVNRFIMYSNLSTVSNWQLHKKTFFEKMIYPLLKVIKYFAIFIIPSKLFRKKSNKILDKAIQNESNSERYIPLYNFTKSNSQVIDLNKCVKKTFEGQEIEVQKNYEEYLIEKFGDWKKEIESTPNHLLYWKEWKLK